MFGTILNVSMYLKKYTFTVILGSASGIFRHIQALLKSTLMHIQNLMYHCQIQNPGTFLSQSIFNLQGIFIIPYFYAKLHLETFDTGLNTPPL